MVWVGAVHYLREKDSPYLEILDKQSACFRNTSAK